MFEQATPPIYSNLYHLFAFANDDASKIKTAIISLVIKTTVELSLLSVSACMKVCGWMY